MASALPHALAQRLDLIGDAQELLHVMADLVGEDVGLGEVALYAEAVLQLLIEVEVDINLLVARAVEGTHLRQPHAASRAHAAGEQHQRGIAIALAIAAEDVAPDILGVGENDGHEALEIVFAGGLRTLHRRAPLPRNREIGCVGARLRQADIGEGRRVAARSTALHDDARVDAEEQHQAENDEKADNADAAAAAAGAAAARKADAAAWEREAEAAAFAPPVLDVLALSLTAPAHVS